MTSFSNEDCEALIELVRHHPLIYDSQLDSYRDENLKDNIWRSIGETLNKIDSECRKKWKLIRDSYNRYKRKHKNPTGSAAPPKRTKWQFYERLKFLDNTPSERQSCTNIEEASNISTDVGYVDTPPVIADESIHSTLSRELEEPLPGTYTQENSISQTKSSEKLTQKRKRQEDNEFIKFLKYRHENRISTLESIKSQGSVDDISTFTKHIETMLRKLSARSRAMAKTEMFTIISKYEIGDIDGPSEHPYSSSSYTPLCAEHQTQSELIDLSSHQSPNEPFQSIFSDVCNNFNDLP